MKHTMRETNCFEVTRLTDEYVSECLNGDDRSKGLFTARGEPINITYLVATNESMANVAAMYPHTTKVEQVAPVTIFEKGN